MIGFLKVGHLGFLTDLRDPLQRVSEFWYLINVVPQEYAQAEIAYCDTNWACTGLLDTKNGIEYR